MDAKNVLLITAALFTLTACSSEPAPEPKPDGKAQAVMVTPKVIYGVDNRMDYYQIPTTQWKTLADSTAALVRNSRISPRPRYEYELKTSNFGNDYNLCPNEPFRDQGTLAFCSGFFVGGDYMITAGHCIRSQSDCDETSIVFGFAVTSAGTNPERAPAANVYHCRKLVKSQVESSGADFAVIQLDRSVANRSPLKLREGSPAGVGSELVVIGHPSGLPTKLAAQGVVRAVNDGFLVASLDTYGGNSGSAVFNATTGEVEGVLVRGEMDFKYNGQCRVSNVCTQDGCRGEDVTRIEFARPFVGQ